MARTARAKRRRLQSEPGPPASSSQNAAALQHLSAADDLAVQHEDLDLAFQLQMKEAIAASTVESDMRTMREDFDLRLHDRKLALEISTIPEHEWQATGDDYERPYPKLATASTSSATEGGGLGFGESFSLYCKGLVVEDENYPAKLGSIGVAIFDSTNAMVFEVSKQLVFPEAEMSDQVAEFEALIEGLEFALNLELARVSYCVDLDVDHDLYENQKLKEPKFAELANRFGFLRESFVECYPSAATINNSKIVLGLARSSIAKQAGKPVDEIFPGMENCPICLEDVDSAKKIYEVGNCQHRFCSSCVQKHVVTKVSGGEIPQCPQPDCEVKLDIDYCRKILAPKMYDILDQLVKESSIPTEEKVYCPNPRCSYLMDKSKVLSNKYSKFPMCRWCVNCHLQFCIDCKVLWHFHRSCDDYKRRKLDPSSADDNLKELAGNKKWRQCPKCSHMVELALGCNHIYCRCGHEFCYVCGFEWKDKKPTCNCQLWAEENIILRDGADGQ